MPKTLDSQHIGTSLEEFHQEEMNDPEYRKEFEKLQLQRKIAELIVTKRKARHLSQQELAERIDSKQAVISRIESGNVSIGLKMLQRIANALGAKIDIILQ